MPETPRLEDGLPTLAVCSLGLGDLLFCTPAFQLLRETLPASEIGVLCQGGFRALLRNSPDVDRTHAAPAQVRGLRRALRGRRFTRELAPFGYRQAVLLFSQKHLPPRLVAAGVPEERIFDPPERLGVHSRDKIYDFTASLLGVEGSAGALRLFPGDDDRRAARALLPDALAAGAPYLVVHTGNSTGKRSRRRRTGRLRIAHRAWPLEHWALLLPLVVQELGIDVVLSGSPAEGEVADEMLAEVAPALRERIHNLAGRTDPLVLAALLEPAAAFVGADTGPTHIAAAAGTPTIGLYGPTNLADTRLLPPDPKRVTMLRTGIECSPCTRAFRRTCRDNLCLREIRPPQVVEALGELMSRAGTHGGSH